jgi:hypothetical protein
MFYRTEIGYPVWRSLYSSSHSHLSQIFLYLHIGQLFSLGRCDAREANHSTSIRARLSQESTATYELYYHSLSQT